MGSEIKDIVFKLINKTKDIMTVISTNLNINCDIVNNNLNTNIDELNVFDFKSGEIDKLNETIFINHHVKDFIEALYVVKFNRIFVNNINNFEEHIIKTYDTLGHYKQFNYLLSQKIPTDKKKMIDIRNLKVIRTLPTKITKDIKLIPNINLNIHEIFSNIAMYNSIKTMYGYSNVYLKVINNIFDKYKSSDVEQDLVFDHVREHINSFNSKGLNIALDEVIAELSGGGDCSLEKVIHEGKNAINNGKILQMAQKVATSIHSKIEKNEVEIDDLVNSSQSFIKNLVNSSMFKGHPQNKEIEDMFTQLIGSVEYLAKVHKENKEDNVDGIDNILSKYETN